MLKIKLNEAKIFKKVTNDKFGLFVSQNWKRLIDPYTPNRTGLLIGVTGSTVDIKPFELHYKTIYAEHVYFSEGHNFFKEKSPFATDHWDVKAEQAGQKDKLYRTLNSALKTGRY